MGMMNHKRQSPVKRHGCRSIRSFILMAYLYRASRFDASSFLEIKGRESLDSVQRIAIERANVKQEFAV